MFFQKFYNFFNDIFIILKKLGKYKNLYNFSKIMLVISKLF